MTSQQLVNAIKQREAKGRVQVLRIEQPRNDWNLIIVTLGDGDTTWTKLYLLGLAIQPYPEAA